MVNNAKYYALAIALWALFGYGWGAITYLREVGLEADTIAPITVGLITGLLAGVTFVLYHIVQTAVLTGIFASPKEDIDESR